MDDGLNALWIKLFLFSKIRAENATFNGILIGSVVMTEIHEASEAGEASGMSETIEARRWRCRSDAWCKGGRCTAE